MAAIINFSLIRTLDSFRGSLYPTHFQFIAAILNFQHTQISGNLRRSFVVLPTPKNTGIAIGNLLISCIQAIFDFSFIRTSGRVSSSLVVLPDLYNTGVAVGISLLSCRGAEIYVIFYLLPRLMAAMFVLPVTRMTESIQPSLIVFLDPESMKVAWSRWDLVC